MKKSRFLSLIVMVLLMLVLSLDASAWFPSRETSQPRHPRAVGAPLDAGLLLGLLGAAGAGYFIIRKKKKESE